MLRNLKIVLSFKKSRYVLEAPLPIDLALDAMEHEKKVFKTRQEDNLRAQSYMLASMNKELQIKHENMQNRYYILVALQELYSENSRVIEYELCATIFKIHETEGRNVSRLSYHKDD